MFISVNLIIFSIFLPPPPLSLPSFWRTFQLLVYEKSLLSPSLSLFRSQNIEKFKKRNDANFHSERVLRHCRIVPLLMTESKSYVKWAFTCIKELAIRMPDSRIEWHDLTQRYLCGIWVLCFFERFFFSFFAIFYFLILILFLFFLRIIIYFFLFLSSLFSTKFWLLISTGTWRDMSWGGLSICKFYFALLFLQFYFHFDFLCLFFHKICIYIYLVKVILAMGEWVLYRVLQKRPQSIYFSFNLGSL